MEKRSNGRLSEVRSVRVGPFAGSLREPVLMDPQRPVAGDAQIAKVGEPPYWDVELAPSS